MKLKSVHPLWTNLPAIAAFAVFVVSIFTLGPFPARVATHFNSSGKANSYGSPWSVFGLVIAISILFIIISLVLDEQWAKQEKKKTFNWFSLMDEIVVGALAGINLGYMVFLHNGNISFTFPWAYFELTMGSTLILAVLVEIARPYRGSEKIIDGHDIKAVQADIIEHLRGNASFIYWDYQNPVYVTVLTTGLTIIMLISAVFSWFSLPLASVLLIFGAIISTLPYGGLNTLVTRENVTVRWGVLGIRVLQLKMKEITTVEIHEFSPLADFGGYGIRSNGKMSAYFLRGTVGVQLTTAGGKKYLLGSDNPAYMAMVISTIAAINK
jgi:hypothetical protein